MSQPIAPSRSGAPRLLSGAALAALRRLGTARSGLRTMLLVLAPVLAWSCDSAAPGGGLTLATAALASSDCGGLENGDGAFPTNAKRVVVRVTGGEIPTDEPLVATLLDTDLDAAGAGVVDDIPEGAGMTVEVVACDGSTPTWSGIVDGIDVTAGKQTNVDVFLTPLDEVACVGRSSVESLDGGHAFGAVWGDGDSAWVAGGFSSYDAATLTLTAGTDVERYDPVQSRFSAAGSLGAARAMALAQVLDDGRLRLFGGTTKLSVTNTNEPLVTGGGAAPDSTVEIFDPATGDSMPVGDGVSALPAVAALSGGVALGAGGVNSAGDAVAKGWRVDPGEVSIAGITTFDLDEPRYAATLIAAGDEQAALLWGGLRTADDAAVAAWIDASGADVTVTALTGSAATGVPLFAAGAWLGEGDAGEHVFVIVGGTEIDAGAGFTIVPAAPRLERVTVDVAAGTFTSESLGGDDTFYQRAAASVAVVGDTLVVGGGFTSFGAHDNCPGEATCFPSAAARLNLGTSGDPGVATDLDLPIGPLGIAAGAVGDGSWLVVGGMADLSGSALDDDAVLLRFEANAPTLCAE